jgi:vacuolar-type H+-ATPase subunit I/STV1
MKYKFIPVDNNINKAIAFANTLDSNNIKNVQRIKQKPFYIETLDVVEMLQNEGFKLKGVAEQRGKSRKIDSHYLDLHHPDFKMYDRKGNIESLFTVKLSNSTSGNTALQVQPGAFRYVCVNNMMHRDYAVAKVKHTEVDYNKLPQIINQLTNQADKYLDSFRNFKNIILTVEQANALARDAYRIRFNDDFELNRADYVNSLRSSQVDIKREEQVLQLLKVNRIEDEGNDLWTVFNRIQENLTAGINNFNTDILVNQKLFTLADQYALAV